jgi:hypothetical protein
MFETAGDIEHELTEGAAKGSGPRQPDREGVVHGLSPAGFHELAYTDWGPLDDKRPIVCVHGLTRQGRDFDHLAEHLVAAGRRVEHADAAPANPWDELAARAR